MRTATLFLSALLLATTTAARAQVLNGEWFKITVSADGFGYDGEVTAKGKVKKTVRYAQFVPPAIEGELLQYSLIVYSPTTEGGWEQAGEGLVSMLDPAETVVHSASLEIPTAPVTTTDGAPNFVQVQFNATSKIKMDGEAVKSAKITSVGATSFFADEEVVYHYGKAKVNMTRVPESKLPFPVVFAAQHAPPKAAAEAEAKPASEPQTAVKPEAAPGKP